MRCWRVGAARGGEGRGKLDDRRRESYCRGFYPLHYRGRGSGVRLRVELRCGNLVAGNIS